MAASAVCASVIASTSTACRWMIIAERSISHFCASMCACISSRSSTNFSAASRVANSETPTPPPPPPPPPRPWPWPPPPC
eukprot:1444300-Prymnesium_polylepis.1